MHFTPRHQLEELPHPRQFFKPLAAFLGHLPSLLNQRFGKFGGRFGHLLSDLFANPMLLFVQAGPLSPQLLGLLVQLLFHRLPLGDEQIGRASCRERV